MSHRLSYWQLQCYGVTRSFDTTRVDRLRLRLVQRNLFYPVSQPNTAAALPYGYFLEAYGLRMNFSLTADSCRRVAAYLAEYLRAGLDLRAAVAFRTLPTRSTRSTRAARRVSNALDLRQRRL